MRTYIEFIIKRRKLLQSDWLVTRAFVEDGGNGTLWIVFSQVKNISFVSY